MINWPPEMPKPDQGSKYSLVVAVAKRARQIVDRRESGVVLAHKPVIIALDEIAQGVLRVVIRPETPKAEAAETAILETPPPPAPLEPLENPQE